METSNQFDPNCVCGGTRERPQPDDCERCQFVVALAAETKRADEAEAKIVVMRAGCGSTIENYRKQEHQLSSQIAEFERDLQSCRAHLEVERNAVKSLQRSLAAAERARDEAVREVERLREVISQTWKECDEARMTEVEDARKEALQWENEGDMYGWNFHQGRAAGMVSASIIYHRIERAAALLQPKEAIDSLPAAEPKALLDPDEVKAVLAEALAPQPMAKVWAEAAINAMCGKVVGDAAAEGGGEG